MSENEAQQGGEIVLGNRAHEGKVGNDGSFCVREEGPWFLCQTICLESDNETRS